MNMGEEDILVEDDSFNFHVKSNTLDSYFEELSRKTASAREDALSSIIKTLSADIRQRFVEKNFITLAYQCMHCIKKGSPKEMTQAARVIGLLSMSVTSDKVHEAYVDLLVALSQGGFKSKLKTLEILRYFAVVTFFGAGNSDETEQAMMLIWDFINSETGSSIERKNSQAVLTDAISAWSFLLSTLDGWQLSYKSWQGAISYFLNLLNSDGEEVCEAACEALALIFEINCLEKFLTDAKESHGLIDEGVTSIKTHLKKGMKDNIIKQLRSRSTETGFSSVLDVLKFLEDGICPNTNVTIGGQNLTVSTWSQKIQLKFMRHVLGKGGFVKHMKENEKFQDVFDFTPKRREPLGRMLYVAEREEVRVSLYLPPGSRNQDDSLLPFMSRRERELEKKKYKSPNSYLSKARTQLLKKQRAALSKERQIDCFDFADEEC